MSNITIIGSGLSGSVIARRHAENGDKVTVFDERGHIGGNVYDYYEKGILIQKYGPHIFHTSSEKVWKYIHIFSEWNEIIHEVKALTVLGFIDLPFNFRTIEQLGLTYEEWEKEKTNYSNPVNLERKALNSVGKTLYNYLIKGYTEKQWGIPCQLLDASIIDRIPVRKSYSRSYFNDLYTALPVDGYTKFVENILNHSNIKVVLNTKINKIGKNRTYYSGRIDYLIGKLLPYRTIYFRPSNVNHKRAVTNFPMREIEYTRATTMNRLYDGPLNPVITLEEHPYTYTDKDNYPFYPIPTNHNIKSHRLIAEGLKKFYPDFIPIGRIGKYKLLDMDKAILEALEMEI